MVNRRTRDINPVVPFIFLHGTDTTVVTNVPTPLLWSHPHFMTHDFGFKDHTSHVRIKRTGGGCLYRFYVQAGATKKAGNPDYMILQLYVNGVAHPCCLSHGAISHNETHADTTLISAFYANYNDYIEIYISVDAGSATEEPDTARFIIEGLAMRGWNNNAAGRINYRGNILR